MGGENKTELMFGKYRAIKEIGRGATSVVYLAEEVNPDHAGDPGNPEDKPAEGFPSLAWGDGPITPRQVAIKVVDFTDDRSKLSRRFRKLFATEAAVTAQFDHPNIAKVYDWKVEDKQAYLVMEYVEGDGLDRFVTMDKLLPMHKVVGIIFKLAMALDYAHRRGIVHRDIKPANALITKDDEVKLMDFGLALNIKKNVNVDSTFINGLGSPSYMSPEQIKGYTLNHQTDLYSLGVMFYQMLTGRLPFRATSTAALVYKIINTEAIAVTQLNPDIPELSDKVIKKALEKDLYSRYRLGADMAKDLSAVRYQILDDKFIAPDDAKWKAVRGLPVLGALDDVDVWELLRLSAWRVMQPAMVLMTEGEAGKSFGFILDGEVEVEKGERAIAKLGRGEIVGEIAYLDPEGGARSATVTALNKVTYLEINPSAFAFATEELREEIQRLATNAMVKRLRAATTLAKRASPLAVHPSAVTGPDIEPSSVSAPVSPDQALGWGAFAQVAAAISQAPAMQTQAPMPAAPALVPEPLAEPATAGAKAAPLTGKSQVLVQPLPAAAAAMIAQMALGNQVMGKAAPDLQPFDLGPEMPDLPLTPVSDLPADAVLTTEMGAHFGMPGGTATTELGNFNAPPLETSEIAPDFDVHSPALTTDMAANFDASQPLLTTDLAPRFDASQQILTTDLAPRFDASQQILTTDLAPRFDASQQMMTSDLAPRFDRSQQLSTSDLAPSFDASQHFATPDQPPRFQGNPMLTTEMGADFDRPPPPPTAASYAASQRPLRPPVREMVQNSTQALAPEFLSDMPPAYPGAGSPEASRVADGLVAARAASSRAPAARDPEPAGRPAAGRPEPAFDMDKTVELSGGFTPEAEDRTVPEEQLGELMAPLDLSPLPEAVAPMAAPAAPVAASAPPPPARPAKMIPDEVEVIKPIPPKTPPRPAPAAFKPGMPVPGASRSPKELQPEDFDKTVILTGGFEAQPADDDSRPVDDLFPPIKF
ncbi:MAG: serine/threonine protein kinase [Betaproteobacteria bacterium]|nr:serine/threonine protein kinase [Betaproteobacteria bacterium]